MRTLLLDRSDWDLVIDANRNIAVADDPYSKAQDAASAIRLFEGECWYDTSRGVPYWTQVLAKFPPIALLKAKFVAAALTVPGVVSAQCFILSWKNRKVTGQVQITDEAGQTQAARF